ncbi:hypothetical protein PMAYCL1PPCAC_04202, partial [Pristionchus mayeri]
LLDEFKERCLYHSDAAVRSALLQASKTMEYNSKLEKSEEEGVVMGLGFEITELIEDIRRSPNNIPDRILPFITSYKNVMGEEWHDVIKFVGEDHITEKQKRIALIIIGKKPAGFIAQDEEYLGRLKTLIVDSMFDEGNDNVHSEAFLAAMSVVEELGKDNRSILAHPLIAA